MADSEVRSLYVFVYILVKTYRFKKSINGKRFNIKIGNVSDIKLAVARAIAQNLETEIRSDQYLPQSSMLVKDACQQYLVPYYTNFVKDKNPLGIIKNFITPYFGDFPVSKLTAMDVQKSIYTLMEAGYAEESIRKRASVGKKLYKILIKYQVVLFNPFNDLDLPTVSNIRNVVLPSEQYIHFIECCQSINSVFSYCILLLLFTGLRVSEAIGIKRCDISLDFMTLILPKTKAGVAQSIVLNTAAQVVIKRCLELTWNEYLFPSPIKTNNHISSPRGCFKLIQELMHRMGHDIFIMVLHDLRRTFATEAYKATGGNSHLIMILLRHCNLNMQLRYVHPQLDAVIAASEATVQSLIAPKNKLKTIGSCK
ncbi:MAG: tyrosine-type recombinase/integrase [Methylococcales bacterium]